MTGMRIVELGVGDRELLDHAVRRLLGVPGVDHGAFLDDPSSVCPLMIDGVEANGSAVNGAAVSGSGVNGSGVNGAEVVGWAWGTRQRHACGYSQLQLYEIEVIEPSRRQGIGHALLTAFLEIGRRNGDAKVYLLTRADNSAAKALHQQADGTCAKPDETPFSWRLHEPPEDHL